jgi:AAHS family 4-hydroxybenzoate transporter-like MFS transporter
MFLCAGTTYVLADWIPTMLRSAGYSLGLTLFAASVLYSGGVLGNLVFGRLMDHFVPDVVLVSVLLFAAIPIYLLAQVPGIQPWIMFPLVFFSGFFGIGGTSAIVVLASLVSPDEIRVTVIGWSIMLARAAGVVAPIGVGMFLADGGDRNTVLRIGSASLAAAGLVVALAWRARSTMSEAKSKRLNAEAR